MAYRLAALLVACAVALPATPALATQPEPGPGPRIVGAAGTFAGQATDDFDALTCGEYTTYNHEEYFDWGTVQTDDGFLAGTARGNLHAVGRPEDGAPWVMSGNFMFRPTGERPVNYGFVMPARRLSASQIQGRWQVTLKTPSQGEGLYLDLVINFDPTTSSLTGSLGDPAATTPMYAVVWNAGRCGSGRAPTVEDANATFDLAPTAREHSTTCVGAHGDDYRSARQGAYDGSITDAGSFYEIEGPLTITRSAVTQRTSGSSSPGIRTVKGTFVSSIGGGWRSKVFMALRSTTSGPHDNALGTLKLDFAPGEALTLYANVNARFGHRLTGSFGTGTTPDQPQVSRFWNLESCW